MARIQAEEQRHRKALSYDWDRSRPTNDDEASAIRRKPVTDWTATEARKMMNHRSYIEASGPEFQGAADDVTRWFQHAFPKDDDPNGPIVTHRSATPMVHEEDRRAVDEAIARRKGVQAQPQFQTMEYRYDTDDPRYSAVTYAQQVSDTKPARSSDAAGPAKPQPEDNDTQGGYDAGGSSDAQAREASGPSGKSGPSQTPGKPARPRPRDGFTTEEPDVEWEGALPTYPEVGKMTYRVNGPIKAKVGSHTLGADGVEFNVDWKPIGPDGKVQQMWEVADPEREPRGGHAGTPAGYFHPPFDNPHGWEAQIIIPPQPAYNGNSANPYVNVWVPKGTRKQYKR